jgi:hypothetical protein
MGLILITVQARGLISLRLRLVRTYSDTDPLKTGARELIDHQPGELNEKEIKKFISQESFASCNLPSNG